MAGIDRANGSDYGDDDDMGRESVQPDLRPRADRLDYDLAAKTRAVFTLESTVPADAFTANSLGVEREGNAVLIGEDGLLLTIGYLVTEATTAWLTDSDGERHQGEVIGYDQQTGYGLVRLDNPVNANPIMLGSAAEAPVGAEVTVVGGGGLDHAMSARLLSKRQFAGYWEYLLDEALFTAPPHPHWSGTALLNPEGYMIGLGSLYVQDALPSSASPPGNMFVPVDMLPAIIDEMTATGRTSREPNPWLGMFVTEADGQLVIAGMVDGGPASRSNLKLGDAILGVAGEDVSDLPEFFRALWARGPAGASVRLNVLRDDRVRDIAVRTGDRQTYLKRMPGQR